MGKREKRWRELEEKYGYPVAEIIEWFRGYPLRYKDIASIFEIDVKTLLEWRRALGLPITRNERICFPHTVKPIDKKAQALGYTDARDATIDIRLCQKLTRDEASEILKVHPVTITRNTPDELKGLLHNMSDKGREVLSRLTAERNHKRPPSGNHPWRHKI